MIWDDLPTFDMTGVKPFYDDQAASARNQAVALTEDLRHSRVATKHEQLHMLHVANAAKHLGRLPAAGETFHCIMRGNYNGWDLVPAILRLAAPATIARLHVATLGFNQRNAGELIQLLDAGSIGRVAFICSCYYRTVEADVFDFLHAELARRGHCVVAIRSHAKILLFEMSDGAAYVLESSANLRSCRNIEQFTLTHDAALLQFHRSWMAQIIQEVLCEEGNPNQHPSSRSKRASPRG